MKSLSGGLHPRLAGDWSILERVVLWLDALLELAGPERRGFVLAHDVHLGPGGDSLFHLQGPVAGVDEQAAQALTLQVLRGGYGAGEDTALFARWGEVRLGPGERHHRVVLHAG